MGVISTSSPVLNSPENSRLIRFIWIPKFLSKYKRNFGYFVISNINYLKRFWRILWNFDVCRLYYIYLHTTGHLLMLDHFLVTFFMRFEEWLKKVDEANKNNCIFYIVVLVLIVLLVSYLHVKASTWTTTDL